MTTAKEIVKGNRRMGRFVLTPPMLFVGVWAGVITLYQISPFRMFTVPVTTTALALHLAGVAAFCVAAAAVARHDRAVDDWSARTASSRNAEWLMWPTVAVLLLLGALVVMKFGLVVRHYGNPFTALHTIRDATTRGAFGFPLVGHLTSPLASVAVLNLGILIADRESPTNLALTLAAFGLIFLNDVTFADQEGLRLAILFLCAVYYGVTVWCGVKLRPARFLRTVAVFAVGITLLVSVVVFRSAPHYTAEGERPARGIGQLLTDAVPVHLYGDIVGNYVSSSWFLAHPLPSVGIGANTLSGFYSFKRLIVRPPVRTGDPDWRYYAPVIQPPGVFNTTDYLAVFASDFGIAGALVLTAALGAGAMWIFLRAERHRRIEDVQVLALVTVGVLTTVRGNYFGAVGFWVVVALVLLQARIVSRLRGAPRN